MDQHETKRHFILVHGMCHGAWCWYKIASMLKSAGHRVTAVDLAGSGVNPRRIEELRSFAEYSEPLMDAMAAVAVDDRAIIVGHSLGGLSISLAMDKFPQNVAAAVFVSAVMPSSANPMSCITKEEKVSDVASPKDEHESGRIGQAAAALDGFVLRHPGVVPTGWTMVIVSLGVIAGVLHVFGKEGWEKQHMDSKISVSYNHIQIPVSSITFGPHLLSHKLYQLSPPEDLVLATMLVRPGRMFMEDTTIDTIATEKSYGLVPRVYIVCKDDKSMTEEFQRWMIERSPGAEVKEIDGADHMVMLSKPKELFGLLMEIASEYY